MMQLFKEESYSHTELNLIAEAFDNVVVKKYLNDQLIRSFSAIAEGEPSPGESAESYLRRQAKVQGSIQVFKQLLEIKKPVPQEDNQ